MGTNMIGFIEVKKVRGRQKLFRKKEWHGMRKLSDFQLGGYPLMGCFFGIRNYARFKPLFKDSRWIPEGVSMEVEYFDCYAEDYCNYVTYDELKSINWDEDAEVVGDWIFSLNPDGTFTRCGTDKWDITDDDKKRMKNGEVITKKHPRYHWMPDNVMKYKMIKMKRNHVRDDNFQRLEKYLDELAERYGKKNVRIVVRFN